MADFTLLEFDLNTGSNGTPTWTSVPAAGAGTGRELRFSDLSNQGSTPSASWPAVTRPISGTAGVDYLYVFTTNDTTSLGVFGGGTSTPVAYSNTAQYRFLRLDWDNTGTFASAPWFTAYPTTGHGAVTRGDGSILGGFASATDGTGTTARSHLKGNAFGRVDSAGVPAAAPGTAPTAIMGTTGSVSPVAGANWLAAGQGDWQGLMGDTDYITAPFTPTATTADQWSLIIRLFLTANTNAGTHTPVISVKYTYS